MKKKTPEPRSKRVTEVVYRNYIGAWREFRRFGSQGDLAKASGVSRSVISRLEAGLMCYRQDQLEPLAAALDCHPAELVLTDPRNLDAYRRIYEDARQRNSQRRK